MKKMTAYRILYAVFLCSIGVMFAIFRPIGWLETDLRTLLPQSQQWSRVQIQADRQQEQRLNQQIVALVGHSSPETAFSLATDISQQWRASGLFQQVFDKIQPDLIQLQQDIQRLKWAVLPQAVQSQLLENPKAYFQHYAEQITNPFGQRHLLPFDQDLLGVGRFVLPQSQQLSTMQWHSENGMLFSEQAGKTWVLLRAELKRAELLDAEQDLLRVLDRSSQLASSQHAEWKVIGTALFAAVAKQQAQAESTLMSGLGVALTLLLLLSVFRSWRVVWLFIPILVGMIAGIAMTVLALGQIHILTLVIGTSLVGVLIDFPLHWLASALAQPSWNAERAMKSHQPTFVISLVVTLLGYGLLWFTDLPVLQQTAVFSAVALLVAMGATLLFLPPMFMRGNFAHRPLLPQRAITTPKWLGHWIVKIGAGCVIAAGLWQSKWQDDIRQWVAISPEMLQEVQDVGTLTGIDLGSQYFLVVAKNDEQLLHLTVDLSAKLAGLNQPHQALTQWLATSERQQQFKLQISKTIRPLDYQPLVELGTPAEMVEQQLSTLADSPSLSLSNALNTTLGQGWQTFYLGELEPNKVATVVKVAKATDITPLQALADNQTIFWQDKRAYLNQAFQQTRNQAAWLKGLSFGLAAGLLWWLFGRKAATAMLAIPLSAIVITVALFGWFGLPITLFTMFGLLLVSAIGVDYTAYMQNASEQRQTKVTAVSLAALTTIISFSLLALSSTPAVASFGLSVSLGVGICVAMTMAKMR